MIAILIAFAALRIPQQHNSVTFGPGFHLPQRSDLGEFSGRAFTVSPATPDSGAQASFSGKLKDGTEYTVHVREGSDAEAIYAQFLDGVNHPQTLGNAAGLGVVRRGVLNDKQLGDASRVATLNGKLSQNRIEVVRGRFWIDASVRRLEWHQEPSTHSRSGNRRYAVELPMKASHYQRLDALVRATVDALDRLGPNPKAHALQARG